MDKPKERKKREPRKQIFVSQASVESMFNSMTPNIRYRVLAKFLAELKPGTRKNLIKKVANGDAVVPLPRGRKAILADIPVSTLLREIKRRMSPKKRKRRAKNSAWGQTDYLSKVVRFFYLYYSFSTISLKEALWDLTWTRMVNSPLVLIGLSKTMQSSEMSMW